MTVWRGRRVLLTGHTGFKGAWAARWLAREGAEVTGLSLPPEPGPNLSRILGGGHLAAEHLVDLRDRAAVARAVAAARPEIVLHLAAQPLVRLSYEDPVGTIGSNVMGTVHLLEALRGRYGLRAILVVTSDKVYENDETGRAYAESDRLGGHDPYSASKAAAEILVTSYARSYFGPKGVPLATGRGGNVIGGGDFAADRLVPDIVRAAQSNQPVSLRNPGATRPWQHVLDCLSGYFTFAAALVEGRRVPPALNFGPEPGARPIPTGEVAARLQAAMGISADWRPDEGPAPHEMSRLAIDASAAARELGWHPRLGADETLNWTADWYGAFLRGEDVVALTDAQIARYEEMRP
jgi:CDP-glucose 4,6-dehydratase